MSDIQFNVTLNDPFNYDISGIVWDAVHRWESIITTKASHIGSMNLNIDISSLDPNVLGSASPTADYIELNGNYMWDIGEPLIITGGNITFNESAIVDLRDSLRDDGNSTLYYVVLHEIGHVLGIGTLWSYYHSLPFDSLTETYVDVSDNNLNKILYTGTNAVREYRNYMQNQSLVGLPIEDDGGSGTAGGHPEEGFEWGTSLNNRFIDGMLHDGLNDELMSGWSEGGTVVMPLSRITIGFLEDMGFGVDYSQADTYMGYSALSFEAMGNVSGSNMVCFLQGMKLLCYDVESNEDRYLCIEDLKPGMLVVTHHHGYVPIDLIGYREVFNPGLASNTERTKNRLYACRGAGLGGGGLGVGGVGLGDLVITGCHSLLVDSLTMPEMNAMRSECDGKLYQTDDKYRLMAYAATNHTEIYDYEGQAVIWHLALKHEDRYMNYGVYANGVLVETCSRRMLEEYSEMTFVA